MSKKKKKKKKLKQLNTRNINWKLNSKDVLNNHLKSKDKELRYELVENLENFKEKVAIYKTRNTRTGNGMRGMRGMQGMFTRIPGNLLEDSGWCYYFNIPWNVEEDSRECWRRFRGMLKKIPGNVSEDSGKCLKRFRGMFEKILGNVRGDSGECSRRFWRC